MLCGKALTSWGPHWFPGETVPVWEPQGGATDGGLLSRDGTGNGVWTHCWGAWFILRCGEGVDMGVKSLLSLLRNRAVFWLKTVFFVSVFIWLFFVFACLCLADHQGGPIANTGPPWSHSCHQYTREAGFRILIVNLWFRPLNCNVL